MQRWRGAGGSESGVPTWTAEPVAPEARCRAAAPERLKPASRRRAGALAAMVLAAVAAACTTPAAAAAAGRFFLSGDGKLALANAHSGERIAVRYRLPSGTYDPEALASIRHFFRSRGDDREGPVSLRLVELLDYLADSTGAAEIVLLSGYRSPAYNAELRREGVAAAEASLHTEGLAADITLAGIDLEALWLRVRRLGCCGAGFYRRGGFVHVDVGPARFWEAATAHVDRHLSAGNARIFARTDFDRYREGERPLVRLHAQTVPLRLSAHARLGRRGPTVTLVPLDGDAIRADGCIDVGAPGKPHRFRLGELPRIWPRGARPGQRAVELVLETCRPRPARTPAEIAANAIAIVPAGR